MSAVAQLRLTSLAAVKRALALGARFQVIDVDGEARHIAVGDVREVAVVQSNAVAWPVAERGGELCWLYWPKATEVTLFGDDRFAIAFGRWTVTYRVPAD